jgi:hypothetical protein
LALKRWFRSRIKDMGESLRLLDKAREGVEANPKLKADIEVVRIHERGTDWVVRDFDPTLEPLRQAVSSEPAAAAARARAIAELEGTTDPVLKNLLGKLKKDPPSANLHWSRAEEKILVIDMQ